VRKNNIINCLAFTALIFISAYSSMAATDLTKDAGIQVSLLDSSGAVIEWADSTMARSIDRLGYRITFNTDDFSEYVSLSLNQPQEVSEVHINGKPVSFPLEGMSYKTVPGIPATLLKKGENVLIAKTIVTKKRQKRWKRKPGKAEMFSVPKDAFSLVGLSESDLSLQTGPVLGYASPNKITVACRVNMPAEVQLVFGNQKLVSDEGLMHTFNVEGLDPATEYSYSLKGRVAKNSEWTTLSASHNARTYPLNGKFEFVAMGDSRSYPETWAKVAASAAARKPMFCAFSGDMVNRGTEDYLWDYELFSPAKEFFATIPFYAVIGNHEDGAPLFNRILPTPNNTRTYDQQIGSVHLIAIDGEEDWAKESKNVQWLESVLAKTDAKFIFLFSHFPAWTSSRHGGIENGLPKERPVREAQTVVVPLMAKYNAAAMVAGHDHCYERSETPDGVTVIVSGGAGAGLREKSEDHEKQNPHSKVFVSEHHYCYFSVDGDNCTMTAYTPDGKVLDTRTWAARK
jgi:hypothetical protein